ncbi:MAG: heavy metal translocating P-type ATPase [Bacteroidota bacterium]|nr:heavy metal translocating P-type ATPase [Bacteroidota bacterium]
MSASVSLALCHHCGLPVRAASHVHAEELYCCYGCEIAHHLLGDPGDEASARLALYKLGAGVLLGINVMMFSMPLYVESLGSFFRQGFGAESFFDLLKWLLMALSLPVFFLLGMPFLESSLRNIRSGLKSNADLLIAIGVTAALLLSIYNTVFAAGPVYYETAVAILVIVTTGRYLEAKSRARASQAIEDLEKSIPKTVVRYRDGIECEIEVSALIEGDIILLKPGDTIPVDSVVRRGTAHVSEAMLSGEPKPLLKQTGDKLLAGSLNYDGALTLEVVHPFSKSYVSQLETLLLESKLQRARIQVLADRISAVAVPVIIAVSIGSFLYWSIAVDLRQGFFAFLSVVLVACPCALGIATPAALWIAVSEASKRGILFRSLDSLERLASVRTIFFDKTGTLTSGTPRLRSQAVNSDVIKQKYVADELHLLAMIREVASYSHHPFSQALADALPKNGYKAGDVTDFQEIPAQGIRAKIDGLSIRIGSHSFAASKNEKRADANVWCSVMRGDGQSQDAVLFNFEDVVRPEAMTTISQLKTLGYNTTILSGDQPLAAERMGRDLGTTGIGGLSPQDKVNLVRSEPRSVFVGDGMNDAGAIGAAQVGIAMGHGSDLIRSGADVILFDRELQRIPQTLQLAQKTMRIVKQNLFWAFAYNIIGVALAAMGYLNPIIAALAMALSSIAVTQNSMRLNGAFPAKEEIHA